MCKKNQHFCFVPIGVSKACWGPTVFFIFERLFLSELRSWRTATDFGKFSEMLVFYEHPLLKNKFYKLAIDYVDLGLLSLPLRKHVLHGLSATFFFLASQDLYYLWLHLLYFEQPFQRRTLFHRGKYQCPQQCHEEWQLELPQHHQYLPRIHIQCNIYLESLNWSLKIFPTFVKIWATPRGWLMYGVPSGSFLFWDLCLIAAKLAAVIISSIEEFFVDIFFWINLKTKRRVYLKI